MALILRIRQERQYGARRIWLYLRRFHQTYVSANTIHKILKRHGAPCVSKRRYRPGPRCRREFERPGQSVRVDVKHPKFDAGCFYQITAIDEATRYRVLKIYDRLPIRNAVHFVDEVRRRLPVAIERIQTDNGNEFGTDFTWHLRDIGIAHKNIPPDCPECNGKVERSRRTDADEFYRRARICGAADLARKLKTWEREYNHPRPHLALNGATPAERLCELKIASRPVQMTA